MTVWYEGTPPQPALGPLAKQALTTTVEWGKAERRLFVLLAAFRDVNVPNPLAKDLAARLGISVARLDKQLATLAAKGVLWTVRAPRTRNHYCLLALNDRVPDHDVERYEVWKRERAARKRAQAAEREAVAA